MTEQEWLAQFAERAAAGLEVGLHWAVLNDGEPQSTAEIRYSTYRRPKLREWHANLEAKHIVCASIDFPACEDTNASWRVVGWSLGSGGRAHYIGRLASAITVQYLVTPRLVLDVDFRKLMVRAGADA